jgi:hypothetical protein
VEPDLNRCCFLVQNLDLVESTNLSHPTTARLQIGCTTRCVSPANASGKIRTFVSIQRTTIAALRVQPNSPTLAKTNTKRPHDVSDVVSKLDSKLDRIEILLSSSYTAIRQIPLHRIVFIPFQNNSLSRTRYRFSSTTRLPYHRDLKHIQISCYYNR